MIKPWESDTGFAYSRRAVERQAREDGRDWRWRIWPFREPKPSIPPVDQESASDFEWELKEAAEDDIASIAGQWHEEDKTLRADYCDAYAELLQARKALPGETAEEEDAEKTLELAKKEYFSFDLPSMDRRWVLFWLALIGLGEFFLNSTVFQILGGGRWETYLAALAVGVSIPLLGHWAGHHLKQEDKTLGDWILIGIAPLAVFGGLYGLTIARAKFAEARGVEIYRVLGVEMGGEEFTLVFLLLNIMLFFVALALAFAGSHREASRFRRAEKNYQAALKALKKVSSEAEAATRRVERAEKAYQRARTQRQKHYQKLRQDALDIRASAELYSRLYRTENARARPDGRPECFDREVPAAAVELPGALQDRKLEDWDCPELPVELRAQAEELDVEEPLPAEEESAV